MRAKDGPEKKWRLLRTWTSRHPLWCAWQVTYRCNFRCNFCGYWHDPMGADEEPSVAQYADGSRKLARLGTMIMSLAGGEPMLREDLPDIIQAVGRYHFPFMTTNGWLVTEESAKAIMEAGLWGISVSIDYADPERHDARRGITGAWEQAWQAIDLLRAARVHSRQRINVIAVLMDDNINDLPKLMEMAARRKVYFMVQPYGHLKIGSRAHEHNNGPVAPRLLDWADRWPNFVSSRAYLAKFDEYLHGGVPGCMAGRAFFNIDSTGDIAMCVERRHAPVANLLTDDIWTIRNRLRAAGKRNDCTECWYNCRGEIESLYQPIGLARRLGAYMNDLGEAPQPAGPADSGVS